MSYDSLNFVYLIACVFSRFVWIGVVYQKIQFNSLVLDL